MTVRYIVTWSKTAEFDLTSIIEYIAEDSPYNAQNVLKKIKKKTALLYTFPLRGWIVPELKEFNIMHYRETIIDTWRLIYRVTENTVFVMAVIDARRNVEDALLDRFVSK